MPQARIALTRELMTLVAVKIISTSDLRAGHSRSISEQL
jgi:hypothetical protein